ncbi:MAG: RNA polymerase sigma factor [Steroidobacteraceae bacterium]
MPKIEPREPDELLAAARAGESDGFAALVRLHQARVFGIALRMLTDRALAEDLAQEVFLQLHRSVRSLDSHQHLVFWLRQVTTRRAIDQLRREYRTQTLRIDESLGLVAAESDADPLLRQHLRWLIGRLAPMPRAILLLRYQEDMDPLDIAQTLAVPVNTVKSHLKRSLAALRMQLSARAPIDESGEA